MQHRLLTLALIVALVGAFVLPPPDAAAQATGSTLLKNIPVVGTLLQDGGTFEGKLSVTRLDPGTNGTLLVSGLIKGTARKADGTRQNINQTFSGVAATLTGNSAACEILNLDLGPINLDLLGLVIDLSAISLDITAVPGPGKLLGNLLCAVAGLLNGTGTGAILNALLNQINTLLGSTGGGLLGGVPVTNEAGTLQDGRLTITQLTANGNELLASGVLTYRGPNGKATHEFANIPLELGTGGNGGCQILNLDLGPLDLDLLGLQVDLSAISLDITAVPGAGNLLGNLLCAVAGLLDGNAGGALANLLNIINRLLG